MMVAVPTRPRMSKGPMIMHICWALVRATVALAKASSFWASCSCAVYDLSVYVKTTHERCGPFSLVVLEPKTRSSYHIKWSNAK